MNISLNIIHQEPGAGDVQYMTLSDCREYDFFFFTYGGKGEAVLRALNCKLKLIGKRSESQCEGSS